MSRIHIGRRIKQGGLPAGVTRHRAWVHVGMPSGNNTVGVPWARAFMGSGVAGFTRMVEGTEPDQITSAEKASIEAGTLLEIEMEVDVDSGGNIVEDRDGTFATVVQAKIDELKEDLEQFGRTAT